MLENDLLEGCEAYHAYSHALLSSEVREGAISFGFELTRDLATRKMQKGTKHVYLLDEIYERTLKTHIERMYCMRFVRSHVLVDRIHVKIKVFDTFDEDNMPKNICDPISYCLCEKGYPEKPPGGIHKLCPELKGLTGKELRKKLK